MRQKSIRKNYFYNFMYEVIVIIVPIILTPYLSRVLGADGVGKYSYYESIASYFVLAATMGMTRYGQREISFKRDSIELRTRIFWETKVLSFITTSICLIAYFVVSLFINEKVLYLIYAFNIICVATDITWFFQGMEEFRSIVMRNIVFRLLSVAFIFCFVKERDDLLLYVSIITISGFLGSISLWIKLPSFLCKVPLHSLRPFSNIGTIISLFVPTIAVQIYAVLDKTMIGMITNDSFQNGYYEQAMKIPKTLLTVITSLGTALIPRIGYYFEKGDEDKIKQLMTQSYKFVWFLGIPMCFGLIIISDRFVPLFLGNGYDEAARLMKLSALLIPIIGINTITGNQYLIPTKQQGKYTISVVVGATLNSCMNLFLIRRYFAYGAVIASVTAEAMIAVIQLFFIRKTIAIPKVIASAKKYLLASIVMTIIIIVLDKVLPDNSIFVLVIIIVGILIYFAFIAGTKDDFMLDNLQVIKSKVEDHINIK